MMIRLILIIFILIAIFNNFVLAKDYNLAGVIYKQVDNNFYGKVYSILKSGEILDVYRGNQKVGKVKIEYIDENKNVLLSIVEGQVNIGDSLYTLSYSPKAEIQLQNSSQNVINSNYTDLPYDKLNDGLKYYSQVLASNTKVIKFGPNSNKPTKVVVDPTQIFMLYSQYENYRLLSSISSMSGVASTASTFFLFNLLSNLWNTYQNIKGPQINTSNAPDSFIQIVYLNENLAKARTILHGYKEAIYDKNYLQNYYNNLVTSTNINDFHIFEITIFNAYSQPISLSPFSYKLYLLSDNKRYRMIKYDAPLDTAVPPGGTITGFVYFPKYDIQSNTAITSSKVRISVEEIGPIKQEILEFR